MKTDDFIRALAADQGTRPRPVAWVLIAALAMALPVSVAGFALALGPRADIAAASTNLFFILKFIVMLSAFASAAAICLHLARPEANAGHRVLLVAIPVALLAAGIVAELALARSGAAPWTARLIGTNARVCMTAIPALSLPLLAAALIGLRHGATTYPTLSGAIAGLAAGALAASLYAMHCTDDSPLFVATWYTLAIAAVAGLGALAGRRILRF